MFAHELCYTNGSFQVGSLKMRVLSKRLAFKLCDPQFLLSAKKCAVELFVNLCDVSFNCDSCSVALCVSPDSPRVIYMRINIYRRIFICGLNASLLYVLYLRIRDPVF